MSMAKSDTVHRWAAMDFFTWNQATGDVTAAWRRFRTSTRGRRAHLGGGGGNQADGGHVRAADGLYFLDVPVTFLVHQLGGDTTAGTVLLVLVV